MKKTGIGFIGAGWMGSMLLKRLAEREDAAILALHQRSRDKAAQTLSENGLSPELHTSRFEDLLENPDVEAVFICSPNAPHGPQAIAALEAGKHVFCEKPCATGFADFSRQVALARENPDLITYVNYIMNFDSLETRIIDMVKADEFGSITQIQVNYRHPVNISGDKEWKLKRESIGDAIGQGIIHSLSVMLNIMAAQGSAPTRVYATSSNVQNRGFEVPPVYNIHVSFENSAAGFCFGNIDHANGYDAYHNIHGTRGGLIFDSYLDRPAKIRYWSEDTTGGKWIYPLDRDRCREEDAESLAWPDDTSTPDSGDVVNHQTASCVDHFMTCLRENQQSPLSFINSALTAELGWAALISAETGQPVDLPLDHSRAAAHFEAHERS
ncbi:MAG: Gfo/Idh/MocA family oxidoreductase [Verrucomicrobiota bacterium]